MRERLVPVPDFEKVFGEMNEAYLPAGKLCTELVASVYGFLAVTAKLPGEVFVVIEDLIDHAFFYPCAFRVYDLQMFNSSIPE